MVTSRDVARLAGVTQPTVSRALRDHPDISLRTRERVKAAAAQLSYVPSQLGRSLSTRRTKRIGIVAAELTNPFYPALLAPVHDALAAAGYAAILITASADDDPDLTALLDGSVDGVILSTSQVNSTLPATLAGLGLPTVLLNREVDGSSTDTCAPDNEQGAILVASLFAELGHRQVGVISGPESVSTSRSRFAAFTSALQGAGIQVERRNVRRGPYSAEFGELAVHELLSADQPPTAIFCGNDVIAIGALNGARRMGVAVPESVTLVGFDDIPLAGWAMVDLTTVKVDLDHMAREAVRLLMNRIAHPGLPVQKVVVPVSLTLRGTHARPANL